MNKSTSHFIFPDSKLANKDGLLATGGDLSIERLILAYKKGIFPWFDEEPILWWTPLARAVFFTDKFRLARSLKKLIRQKLINQQHWEITTNRVFSAVIENCGRRAEGSWINQQMKIAYENLHKNGYAHSFELWDKSTAELIGGLYGVQIGKMFYGESMFSKVDNASKILLFTLCEWMRENEMPLLDAQVPNRHLQSLGMILLHREDFEYLLSGLINKGKCQLPEIFTSEIIKKYLL